MAEIPQRIPRIARLIVAGGRSRLRIVLSMLIVLFVLLHSFVLLVGNDWWGEVYTLARQLYHLVAYAIIALATWYGARGWHGLFAAVLILLVYHSPLGATLVAPNIAATMSKPELGLLMWFDDVIFRLLMCFAIALTVKPIYVSTVIHGKAKPRYDLVDMLWITFALALAFFAWQRLGGRSGLPWQVFVGSSISMTACSSVMMYGGARKISAAVLMMLAVAGCVFLT